MIIDLPRVQFAIAAETIALNAGTFQILVTLSAAIDADTTIAFTRDGSALLGEDYTISASPLVIPAGQKSAIITGAIVDPGSFGDGKDATLILTLGALTNANAGATSQNTLTISAVTARPNLPDLSAQQRYVQALYLAELGRAGAVAELDAWVKVLNDPGAGAAIVVNGISQSREARTRLVRSWYENYLGRSAVNGEEQFWVSQIVDSGKSEETVLSQILGSDELFARAQTMFSSGSGNERYLRALYALLLHRPPAAAEVTAWLDALPRIGQANTAISFLNSIEHRTIVVTTYYQHLLHRQPDASASTWAKSTATLASIRFSFEMSHEFANNG